MVECECGSKKPRFYKTFCFNRYMVECEFEAEKALSKKKAVLIDTWWNVNSESLTCSVFPSAF